jgi:hypothetical protein
MASIITATTANGLVSSADNSGVLQLASGTGNLVTVPSVTGTAMVSGNMPAFSAYQNSAQTFTTGAFNKLQIDTEEFDTANCFNTGNYRFTPNVAGYYQVNAVYNLGGSGTTLAVIFKNGSAFKYGVNSTGSSPYGNSVSCLMYMNGTTDYIEFYGYTNGTGYQIQTGSLNTWFQAVLVRSA